MTQLTDRLAALSPERRELLEQMLAEKQRAEAAGGEPRRASDPAAGTLGLPQIAPAPADRFAPFPLTDIQQAQWIGGRSGAFELGKVAAHLYVEFDARGLDLDRLGRAWQQLVEQHDQLRMVVIPGELKQRVLQHVPPYQLATLDLREAPQPQLERALQEIRDRMSHQILPGDRWPLWEVRASRLPGDTVRVHVSFDLLVADAWSFRVLMDRWMMLYDDLALPEQALDITYRDYVLQLEKLRDTSLHQRSLAYWRERLPTLYPPPALPLAKSYRDLPQQHSRHYGVRLQPETWDRLKKLGRRAGLTHSGLFLSAFAEVLGLYSQSQRFTVNVTVFNRLPFHPQVNDILVGEFNSFVLVAIDLSRPEGFLGRAKRIQEQLWEDLEHRFVSGVQIMRELAQVTGRSTGALMPVVFTSTLAHFEDEKRAAKRWPGEMVYEVSQTPQIWLEHHIWEEEGALLLRCDAVDELFPTGFLASFFKTYERFLHRLADGEEAWTEPGRGYLLPAEDAALYAHVNATQGPAGEGLLHDGVSAQGRRRAEAPALLSASGRVTYGALEEQAGRVALHLAGVGVRGGDTVAIVMEPGLGQIVATLGALKAGAVYLPVDPHVPPERRLQLVREGRCAAVLAAGALSRSLAVPEGCAVVDVEAAVRGEGVTGEPAAARQPSDLAYVIFTSGSTGQPKGVMIEHRAAVNTIADINERFGVGPNDRVLALSNLNFDLSVYDIFGLLSAGGAMVIPEGPGHRDPAHWDALMREHGVTVWNSVPALLEMYLGYLEAYGKRVPESLRLVLLSGDWIGLKQPERLRALGGEGCRIISLGGATEASIWSISYPIEHVDPAWRSIPYGKPLRNQRMYVLNERMEPCPRWVPGELYIGGIGLARGYWGDEAKTAERFVTHPVTGERLYRTGDYGRYWPDGNIEFLGRQDTQVKVHGHRIELGEIEAVLQQHPGVKAAVVLAMGDGAERHLVGFVAGGEELSAEAVAERLRARLPDYMVPGQLHVLAEMPQSHNGKIDRKVLQQLALRGPTRHDYVVPRTPLEEQLASIWARVLNREQIGVFDNFFDLGGNSLTITQVAARLFEATGRDVPLRTLYDAPTIAELSREVEKTSPDGDDATRMPDLAGDAVLPAEIRS